MKLGVKMVSFIGVRTWAMDLQAHVGLSKLKEHLLRNVMSGVGSLPRLSPTARASDGRPWTRRDCRVLMGVRGAGLARHTNNGRIV
jgi:hypothetical protein